MLLMLGTSLLLGCATRTGLSGKELARNQELLQYVAYTRAISADKQILHAKGSPGKPAIIIIGADEFSISSPGQAPALPAQPKENGWASFGKKAAEWAGKGYIGSSMFDALGDAYKAGTPAVTN